MSVKISTGESLEGLYLCRDSEYERKSPLCKLIMRMPVIICAIAPGGEVSFVNHTVFPVTGYQPEEVIGKNWWDIFFPGELRNQVDIFLEHAQTSDLYNYEMTIQAKDGRHLTMLCSSVNIYGPDGKLETLLRFGIDITERKMIETELKQSEERLRQLTEVGFEGIILQDDGQIINTNRVFQAMFGYDLEDIQQMGDPSLLLTPEFRDIFHRNIEDNYEGIFEAEGIKCDGTRFPVLIQTRRIPFKKRCIQVTAIRDLTLEHRIASELRHERDFLTKIMETSPTGIVLFDRNGKHLFVNRAIEEAFAIPHDSILDMDVKEIPIKVFDCEGNALPPESRPFFLVKNSREPVAGLCLKLQLPDGKQVVVSVNMSPLFDDEGEFDGTVAVITDISERFQKEQQLRELSEKLEERAKRLAESNADLEQFAFVASHDLREPLNVIIGYAKLLQERFQGVLGGEAAEFLSYIQVEADLMQRLISGLLDLSRVATRGKEFHTVDTNKVLEQTLLKLHSQIRENNAEITWSQLPSVLGDEDQLGQVFQNIISNAIKFRREETPRIHIDAVKTNSIWQFSIQDNGMGIEEKDFRNIFKIFHQVHRKPDKSGYGIGLAVSEKIIHRHGGTIRVESEPGKGSTFYFTLPASECPAHLPACSDYEI